MNEYILLMKKIRYKFSQQAQIEIIEEVMSPLIQQAESKERYDVERINSNRMCKIIQKNNIGIVINHNIFCDCWGK